MSINSVFFQEPTVVQEVLVVRDYNMYNRFLYNECRHDYSLMSIFHISEFGTDVRPTFRNLNVTPKSVLFCYINAITMMLLYLQVVFWMLRVFVEFGLVVRVVVVVDDIKKASRTHWINTLILFDVVKKMQRRFSQQLSIIRWNFSACLRQNSIVSVKP